MATVANNAIQVKLDVENSNVATANPDVITVVYNGSQLPESAMCNNSDLSTINISTDCPLNSANSGTNEVYDFAAPTHSLANMCTESWALADNYS